MNGVLFGSKHSFKDWGLLLKERPIVSPAPVKSSYVDVLGASGTLDLTELDGDVKYGDRNITCKFEVLDDRKDWHEIYSTIQDYLHGQRMKIVLDEDCAYYYEGRCAVDEWASSKVTSTIVIKAVVDPYKNELFSSLEPWKWDEFNFEKGIIRDYADIAVDGVYNLLIDGTRKQVIPTFYTTGELEVEFDGKKYTLPLGESRILNIVIKEGKNILKFTGHGVVSVEYRGGRL